MPPLQIQVLTIQFIWLTWFWMREMRILVSLFGQPRCTTLIGTTSRNDMKKLLNSLRKLSVRISVDAYFYGDQIISQVRKEQMFRFGNILKVFSTSIQRSFHFLVALQGRNKVVTNTVGHHRFLPGTGSRRRFRLGTVGRHRFPRGTLANRTAFDWPVSSLVGADGRPPLPDFIRRTDQGDRRKGQCLVGCRSCIPRNGDSRCDPVRPCLSLDGAFRRCASGLSKGASIAAYRRMGMRVPSSSLCAVWKAVHALWRR